MSENVSFIVVISGWTKKEELIEIHQVPAEGAIEKQSAYILLYIYYYINGP